MSRSMRIASFTSIEALRPGVWSFAARAMAALFIFGSAALAQPQPTPAGQTTFRSDLNEVIVPITTTDSKGRFISDLVQSDFHVFDEGKEQKIDFFSHEQSQPVVIGFLLDMSNSMKVNWSRYKESTKELMLTPQIEITSKHQFPTLERQTTDENKAIRLSYGLGWGLFFTPYGRAFFKEGHFDKASVTTP